MPAIKHIITPEQESFIRENYLLMSDYQISKVLALGVYHIQLFRQENNLRKKNPNKERVEKMGKYFNVKAKSNWLV